MGKQVEKVKLSETFGVVKMPKLGGPLPPYCQACQTRKPKHDKHECRVTILRDLDQAARRVASCQRRLAKLEQVEGHM